MTKKEKILARLEETQHTRDNLITIADICREFEVSRSYIYQIKNENKDGR